MGRALVKPTQNLRKTPEQEPQETDPLADLVGSFDDVDLDAILVDLAAVDLDDLLVEWAEFDVDLDKFIRQINIDLAEWAEFDLGDILSDWTNDDLSKLLDDLTIWSPDDLLESWGDDCNFDEWVDPGDILAEWGVVDLGAFIAFLGPIKKGCP